MTSNDNNLSEQINKLVDEEHAQGLIDLIDQLNASELLAHSNELTEACESVFYVYLTDLQLEKIRREDQEAVIMLLFELQQAMEKIAPDQSRFILRGELYEHLATLKTDIAEKKFNLQKAIDEYTEEIKLNATSDGNVKLAEALLTRMELLNDYHGSALTEVLQLFRNAFTHYAAWVLDRFFYSSFRLLNFPLDNKHDWHTRFIQHLETALASFAQQDNYVNREYAENLMRILNNHLYNITTSHRFELKDKITALLGQLTNYDTTDERRLNELGQTFEKVAALIEPDTAKLPYYEVALNYFKKGQDINPATWTFPVYATNILMAKAAIYHQANNSAGTIALFESGRALFARTATYSSDFTLMLYWGNFLLAYAKSEYSFNAPDILEEAREKLLIAKELGNGYYDQPYRSLAKIALKLGDKQQCLDILQACKQQFSTDYYTYEHNVVLRDEDFKDIWNDLADQNKCAS